MEYFKDKIFPEVFKSFLNFLSGFLLLYIGSVLKKSSEKNSESLFSFNLSPAFSFILYAVYFSLFLFFIWKGVKGIKAILFSHIDHLQNEYIPPNIDLSKYDDPFKYYQYSYNRKYDSFVFRVKEMKVSEFNFIPDVLLKISDPKCADEDCVTDLIIKRSYFGFYRYSCPTCKKKYISKYNQSTFKDNLKKVIFAEHEKQEDKLPF